MDNVKNGAVMRKQQAYPLLKPLLSPSPAAVALTATVPACAKTADFRCADSCMFRQGCNTPSEGLFFIVALGF
jgi:hypothetical protein